MLIESVRKVFLVKWWVEKLRCEYNCLKIEDVKVYFLNVLIIVNNVLEVVFNEFLFEDGVIVDVVFVVYSL